MQWGKQDMKKMAYNDLKALDVPLNSDEDMPPALPATEVMIAYVKYLSLSEKPWRSLGYHYWIEQPYDYILPFMQALKHNMGLKDEQMSFYLQHVKIDQKHGKDIQNIVMKVCETDEQWEEIKEMTRTSLWLMFRMVQDIIDEYEKLANGKSVKFKILNHIEH
jgi:pyrroloquinoline quinone (PQQ) biosynthesis protein C